MLARASDRLGSNVIGICQTFEKVEEIEEQGIGVDQDAQAE